MSYYAAPDKDYGVLRYYDIEIRQFWLTPLTGYLYIMLWLSGLGSYLAMMVDKYRSRRRSDNAQYNLWFLLIINMAWLVYILIKPQ
jgi:ABC-type multidrug transport system permease subunit